MFKVEVKGMRRVTKMLKGLPPAMNKEIMKKSDEFMRFVQKSAKLRAPRWTGALAESIKVKKKANEIILTVDSPYGLYQERGFKPHWVHAWLPTKNTLGTVGDAFNIGGFAFVQKSTPFIRPALEAGLSNLPNMLKNGTKIAINKARR